MNHYSVGDIVETKIGNLLATVLYTWPHKEMAKIYIYSRDTECIINYSRIKKL
jgi:hypothetical protein